MTGLRRTLGRASLREFGWLSLGNQLGAGGALMTMLVLARTQSLQSVGQVVFAQAVAAVVLMILDVRFEDAMQRFYPIIVRSHGRSVANSFFWRICRFDGLLGACVAGLALLVSAAGLIPQQGSWVPMLVTLALLSAGAGTMLGTLNSGFAVAGQLTELAWWTMACTLTTMGLTIAGVLIAGPVGFLVGQLLGTVFQVGATGFAVRRHVPWPSEPTRVSCPGLVRFLAKSSAASSLAVGSEPGVLAIGGVFGSPTFVALLKIAQAPGRVVAAAFSPLAVQAFPRLAARAAEDDQSGVRKLALGMTTRVGLVAAAIVLVATPLMKSALGLLYGHQFEVAWLAALALLAAACLRAATAWSKVLPLAIGRPGVRLGVLACESAVLLVAAVVSARATSPRTGVIEFSVIALLLAAIVIGFWIVFVLKPMNPASDATDGGVRTHG